MGSACPNTPPRGSRLLTSWRWLVLTPQIRRGEGGRDADNGQERSRAVHSDLGGGGNSRGSGGIYMLRRPSPLYP
ncbi:hypothetical protein E2562_017245 [Oryza meyeriana var. granulata]|uniref:Uncharacterized protein n=1 Tax=Oryza meyeriana var. granulata TaxID=110450 RepID=A0A6G1ELH4_9ORYZ|nr:hypothetical protein E2562_017245 [Oryza meyeriana var. granulata]